MRRRFTRRAAGGRKRAIWVNIPFTYTMAEVAGFQTLVIPEYWEAQFSGENNETATLRAIRGAVSWQQTANGTLGRSFFWGLGIMDVNATVVPSFSIAGMAEVDWLHVDAFAAQGSFTGTVAALQSKEIAVKAKRKLKSRDQIFISGQSEPDAAANPTANINGVLRFLIARD